MGNNDLLPSPGKPGWYYRLSSFFRKHLGSIVYKIPINAGFSCPNRDGTIGWGGCTYCYNPAFSPAEKSEKVERELSVTEQIRAGIKRNAKGERRYLAYFQAYTNTYGSTKRLRALYDEALQEAQVIGLSVATRPDCVDEAVLELLESYARRRHVWLELGLQSAHESTLKRINRGHTAEQFQKTVELARERGIFICAHLILGLPGESREMALETMQFLNDCNVDGVKFHHLQIINGTAMQKQYLQGEAPVFERASDYIPLLCDCLEHLDPRITIHRLAAQVTERDLLVAPHWNESATQIAAAVDKELKSRGNWQGAKVNSA